MSAESHRAAMSAPIRNVVTDNGGSTVDQGFMVEHTHDDEPPATAESVQDAIWRTAQRLLLIPAIVCAVLAAMVFFNKGTP